MVREGRRGYAIPQIERHLQLVVFRGHSRRKHSPAVVSRLGLSTESAVSSRRPVSQRGRSETLLESVPAPELVFHSLASRLSFGFGETSPGGHCFAGRPVRLGSAILELLWTE